MSYRGLSASIRGGARFSRMIQLQRYVQLHYPVRLISVTSLKSDAEIHAASSLEIKSDDANMLRGKPIRDQVREQRTTRLSGIHDVLSKGTNEPQKSAHMKTRDVAKLRSDGKPVITVLGVGGAGGNAVNNMISSELPGVKFAVANTDAQALARSFAQTKLSLGTGYHHGLGAGSKPELGRLGAENQLDDISATIAGSNMLFITGGMGGGTCTGAAPVIARTARDAGILTVAVVTTPFHSEGPNRTRIAHDGVRELAQCVDTLIVVPNQNLLSLATKSTTIVEAFRHVDTVLMDGVRGVTNLILNPGVVNLDFADIRTILAGAGRALMGVGEASGSGRTVEAATMALSNPLLGDLPTLSATGLLVTISGSSDLTLREVDEIMSIIGNNVSEDANIIFGSSYDESLRGKVRVSVIIGGIVTDEVSPPVRKHPIPTHPVRKPTTQEILESGQSGSEERSAMKRGLFARLFSF